MFKQHFKDQVVVITGASSGIGRATALALAEKGARVVLVSRREEALQELARECEACGGQALALRADVTDPEAMQNVVRQAVDRFGHIDVWMNNAAVSLFGRIDTVPLDDYKRVIETNVFGTVHGIRAVLPHFREQGKGHIIIVSSVAGKIGQPYTSAYGVSKFALTGLAESLRMELMVTGAREVHVSTVLPASIDTPLFQSAANYTGWAAQPIKPIYTADSAAQVVLSVIKKPQREAFVGSVKQALMFKNVAPGMAEAVMARTVRRKHFQGATAQDSPGNLYDPLDQQRPSVAGGWGGKNWVNRRVSWLPLIGAALAGTYLLYRLQGDRPRHLKLVKPSDGPLDHLGI
jgi:short-subunit dehydrogenase